MASAGDGAASYQSEGAGGKFRKRPIRRSAHSTPYDRPSTALRNNNPSLLAKLVDPASRLIYAGADRLFGVFRKRFPSIAAQRPPEINEEPRNGLSEASPNKFTEVPKPSTDEGGNLASISAATEISELENILKQKTFTRSEIEHLTKLLHGKSDIDEGKNKEKLLSPSSHLLRLEASTSGLSNKQMEERENINAAIATPVVSSRVFEEDVASPAELARAYMGSRTPKVSPPTMRFGSQAPRQDSVLLNSTTIIPKTPITSLALRTTGSIKGFENGFTTPRSRGRSAIYNMARTPYYRGPSTLSQKGVSSPPLPLSRPAWEPEGSIGSSKMALKRRSSVMDDIGSGGPMRRIRQKANLLSQGSPLTKPRNEIGQKLSLRNEPGPKSFKAVEEKGETSRSNLGNAFVPTKSSQMASKILEQLERLSPKEKSPGSRLAQMSEKSPSKLISDKVDSPKLLLTSKDNQKPEGWLADARESTSGIKDKVEEHGSRKFAVPQNVMNSMNGNSTVLVRDKAPIITNTDSTFKLPAEPPQKKRFQMSAPEDSLEPEDKHSNGHVSFPFSQSKKLVFGNKDASTEVIQTPAASEVQKASPSEADKVPAMPEFKKIDAAASFLKTDFKSAGGSGDSKQIGFNFSAPPPSSSNNAQSAVFSQSILKTDTVAPEKKAPVFPTFGINTKKSEVTTSLFSANEPKPNASSDAKPVGSTSLFKSVEANHQVQVSAPNKEENGTVLKSANMSTKSETLFSANPTTGSTSGIFSFSGKTSSITNGAPSSSPSLFASSSSFTASDSTTTTTTTTSKLFSGSSSFSTAASSTTTTSVSSSAPAPIFSFGSAPPSSTSAAEDKQPKSENVSTSLFASTTFATASSGGSITGFSSSAATSTTNGHSLFNGFQSSFGGPTAIPSSTSGSSLFGSSVPTFGLSSAAASTEVKFGSSTSSLATNVSGSAFSSTPSFGLTSSETKSNSTWQPPKSSVFGSTPTTFNFGAASSTPASSSPSVFGSSGATNSTFPAPSIFGNSTPVFGSAAASPNNNDQMSMEDSMAEDSTPSPAPVFGQSSGFMFGSSTPTPPPSTVPFQFGGQANPFQASGGVQNPFQASGSADFSGGGSFSLGSGGGGGGDKSGRRIVRVKRQIRKK